MFSHIMDLTKAMLNALYIYVYLSTYLNKQIYFTDMIKHSNIMLILRNQTNKIKKCSIK